MSCDASNIVLEVIIEIDNNIVEDAAWLRKKEDCSHICLAEIDAVVKGVISVLKWSSSTLNIITVLDKRINLE